MPLLVLAPMAGVSDLAYRSICAELGADVTVTEMVSSRGLVYHDKKTQNLLKVGSVGKTGLQLFGNEPEVMAQAAQLALACSPEGAFIDLNMGCPTPKIVNNGDGCALMKNIPLAAEIVRAVVRAVPVPVTVKMRLGWDRGSLCAPQLAVAAQDAGASAVAVHGRTRVMGYSGRADWDAIADVVRAVDIPVIANGDITCAQDAQRCLSRTGAAGVMIGRTAFGNPNIFSQTAALLAGRPVPEPPPLARRMELALRQFHMALADKGEFIACLEARKYFCWYLRGVAHSGYCKQEINRMQTAADVEAAAARIVRELR